MVKEHNNKGFSLVELIIVIAILAILSAAIAPALIRYINKARKADDIATADSIGTTVNAAYTDNEYVYDYINEHVNWLVKEKGKNSGYLRIVGMMNAGYVYDGYHFTDIGNGVSHNLPGSVETDGKNELKSILEELMGEAIFKLKFTNNIYMDQWVICVDEQSRIHILCGGGLNGHQFYIKPNHILQGGANNRLYQLWPSVDPEYNKLNVPPKEWDKD
jgi:prepilin-type N-terminal cleavage/methylation domain-containing protein